MAENVGISVADTVAAYLLLLAYDVTRTAMMKKCKTI